MRGDFSRYSNTGGEIKLTSFFAKFGLQGGIVGFANGLGNCGEINTEVYIQRFTEDSYNLSLRVCRFILEVGRFETAGRNFVSAGGSFEVAGDNFETAGRRFGIAGLSYATAGLMF